MRVCWVLQRLKGGCRRMERRGRFWGSYREKGFHTQLRLGMIYFIDWIINTGRFLVHTFGRRRRIGPRVFHKFMPISRFRLHVGCRGPRTWWTVVCPHTTPATPKSPTRALSFWRGAAVADCICACVSLVMWSMSSFILFLYGYRVVLLINKINSMNTF